LSCADSDSYKPNSKELAFVQPDSQFVNIYLEYDFNKIVNTFNKTYKVDLFSSGISSINFWFTTEEQKSILKIINAIDYFSLPDTLINYSSILAGDQILRVKYQLDDKTTVVKSKIRIKKTPKTLNDSLSAKLQNLNSYIISIIESKTKIEEFPH
jgi:hypothetical protein